MLITNILLFIGRALVFSLLTLLTQVGGIPYLLSFLTHKKTDSWAKNRATRLTYRFASFALLYLITTLVIVPLIAKPLGRVQLPLTETNHVQPLNAWTYFLNRNYVRPQLRNTVYEVANKMQEKYPGTIINYLDANFPFTFTPLLPHRSHNDGKKLDLSFCYKDAETQRETNECPSWIGYGVCEEPKPNEANYPNICADNWQYSFMQQIVSQKNKVLFSFDQTRTKYLANLFAGHPSIGKLFIEPHLKNRMKLTNPKFRFHGCTAVRHDDHLHVQLY